MNGQTDETKNETTTEQNSSSSDTTSYSDVNTHKANYNVAPTTSGAVYYKSKDKCLINYMKWGLVPQWVKDLDSFKVNRTFNAREENLLESKIWKPCVNYKRCVVPITGYYEWKTVKNTKSPYFITRQDGKLMFLAGLYDYNNSKNHYSFTIVTNSAPKELEWLHHRMPVVLEPNSEQWDMWMNENKHDWYQKELDELLKATYNPEVYLCYQVSKDVGKVGNKDENLIKPIFKEDKKKLDLIKREETHSIKKEVNDVIKDEDVGSAIVDSAIVDSKSEIKSESSESNNSSTSSDTFSRNTNSSTQNSTKKRKSITDMLRASPKRSKK